MIPKSGYRFSEKIMLKQQAKANYRIKLKSFRETDRAQYDPRAYHRNIQERISAFGADASPASLETI